MHTDEDCAVLIEFKNFLPDAVIDELGEVVELRKVEDENFTARFKFKICKWFLNLINENKKICIIYWIIPAFLNFIWKEKFRKARYYPLFIFW